MHQARKNQSRQRDEKGVLMTHIDFSPQQLTVMQLSWNGLSIKESAAHMGLSEKTVKNYRQHIYDKMGVSNVEGMLRQGVERGLLTASSGEEWP
jgi:DNA-binding NarL/FixJ family response regulator